jgi:NitT/TauT family transport system permease protein
VITITVTAICAWEIVGRALEIPSSILPTPSRIAMEVWREAAVLRDNGVPTCLEMVGGLLMAILSATFLGIVLLFSGCALRVADRLIRHWPKLPLVALAPLFLVWFGFEVPSRTAVAWCFGVLPMLQGITTAARSFPEELSEWLRTTGAGPMQRVLMIYLPASLPFFFRSLRLAVSLALSGALVAEVIGAEQGLGYLLLLGAASSDIPLLLATVCVASVIIGIMLALIRLLERFSGTGRVGAFSGARVSPGQQAHQT